ncbi:hypothetical protein PHMEG_00010041 [Phytophthora megakarya]|uniref:M96 mating-specific protein n=1 Tax=Phytophthora megakarya TaxID=4795 RepID=A0A225WG16_9STRA|nr:hypothetical protein PHMEG_00010041 [Phytophthora megakarya]
MVQFRLRKKLNESKLRTQHQELQLELERSLTELKRKSESKTTSADSDINKVQTQLQKLILQGEELRAENATLRQVVATHNKFQQVIYSRHQPEKSDKGEGGWRVNFPNGAPSFHFHPFSKDESVAIVQRYDRVMNQDSKFQNVGTLLGWQVERTPLVRHTSDKWMITRVRFSKQINCAAGASKATMDMLEAESWPVLTTPELCPRVHRANCTTLKLQEVDEDTVVLVSNTPQYAREMHLRHLTMMHRRHSIDSHQRRTITYVMVIPDSKANRRSREAEDSRDTVLWVCEGAAYMTLTQIDDSTLEVSYDNCSGCKNELHAQHLLMEWGHEAIRWEQLVTPSRLLAM